MTGPLLFLVGLTAWVLNLVRLAGFVRPENLNGDLNAGQEGDR